MYYTQHAVYKRPTYMLYNQYYLRSKTWLFYNADKVRWLKFECDILTTRQLYLGPYNKKMEEDAP